ncbi:hypothetical protein [Paenibacillus sp. GbtcB18]|uniref:hypothetical protein n=1 Tax=Paenibacillus sp. GbtcB18 TaxID=2824763 RepID=UPI001C308951|nr:hypothetical protein [Paenibacillus sp. GbtcB18]
MDNHSNQLLVHLQQFIEKVESQPAPFSHLQVKPFVEDLKDILLPHLSEKSGSSN